MKEFVDAEFSEIDIELMIVYYCVRFGLVQILNLTSTLPLPRAKDDDGIASTSSPMWILWGSILLPVPEYVPLSLT
jgi:hypothetical protein